MSRPEEFFESPAGAIGFSYRFIDRDGRPVPNEMGYRAMRYIKPSCVMHGRAVIAHTDVNPILAEYSRDEIADILEANDEPWKAAPTSSKKERARDQAAAVETHEESAVTP